MNALGGQRRYAALVRTYARTARGNTVSGETVRRMLDAEPARLCEAFGFDDPPTLAQLHELRRLIDDCRALGPVDCGAHPVSRLRLVAR